MLFLVNSGAAFFTNVIPFFSASFPAWSLLYGIATSNSPRIPPDCIILVKWGFKNFILTNESFAKALWSFETCVLVKNKLWEKFFLLLELPIKFDESFKVT